MTVPLFLSRLTLLRDAPSVAPLIDVLAPDDEGRAMAMTHKLMWTLMPEPVRNPPESENTDSNDSTRTPFLWRADAVDDRYFLLGPEPVAHSPFFRIETKPFAPQLVAGDRLAFSLRLNATVDRIVGRKPDGRRLHKRSDIAMDLMLAQEKTGNGEHNRRAARREPAAQEALTDWLGARGPANGYELGPILLEGYRTVRLPRSGAPAIFGIFDVSGQLTVTDPQAFLPRLSTGFGRAKAFGCGLMLIRRAP